MWSSMIIKSKGPTISGFQLMLIEQAAAQYLSFYRGANRVQFQHPKCGGIIKYKKEGVYHTFSGTIFEAYITSDNGKVSECEFIVGDGREHLMPENIAGAIYFEPASDGRRRAEFLDTEQIPYVEVSKVTTN